MKLRGWILLLVLIGSRRDFAQAKPDFSGSWSAPGAALVIKQDSRTLTIGQDGETRTYSLDGFAHRLETAGRGGTSQVTSEARWIGSALLVTTRTVSGIGTWEDLEVYSLDYGPKLTVVRVTTQTTQPMMNTTTTTYTPRSSAGNPAR